MKAWLLKNLTGLDQLEWTDVPDPAPGPGEVLMDVEFAALNPADRFLAEGQYPAKPRLPHVLGRDGIGTIAAVGEGVDSFHVGQRVLVLRGETGVTRWGTFAQRTVVATDSIVAPPADWTAEQCAAAPLVYLTAYQALTQWGALPPGMLLVTGASGGVGIAGIQLGRALGHHIVALSRSREKRSKLLNMGVEHVCDPSDPDWPAGLLSTISPRRIDLAIDNVAGPMFPQVIATLGNHGKVSVVGRSAGPVPSFNTGTLFFRRLRIGGVAVGAYTRPEAHAAWEAVVGLLGRSGDKPIVDSVFPFDQLPAAFQRLSGGVMGKVVLAIGGK